MTLDASLVSQPQLSDSVELTEAPAAAERFGRRWRLVGAGLSNVWRYGDLVMDATSGRLLMRGPNGTGKTTALEALWPYLLDLNARTLGAGQARQTTLGSLMRDGATSRRRVGYVWLTFAGPADAGELTFGVRLQYSEGSSPTVKVVPFRLPVRPVHDLSLVGEGRSALSLEEFTADVTAAGGHMFADEDEYLADLAARLLRTTPDALRQLAALIRQVRNPNLLGDLSPRQAREALREALPGVTDEVIRVTADALAESEETRKAFDRDRDNADVISAFAAVWAGHVADVLSRATVATKEAKEQLRRLRTEARKADSDARKAGAELDEAKRTLRDLEFFKNELEGRLRAYENSDAYQAAGALTALESQLDAEQRNASSTWRAVAAAAANIKKRTDNLAHQLDDLQNDIAAQQQQVAGADPATSHLGQLVTVTRTPALVFSLGEDTADPGAALVVRSADTAVADAAVAWRQRASEHAVRADSARVALDDHKPVAAADVAASDAEQKARSLAIRLDEDEQRLRVLVEQAAAAVGALAADLLAFIDEEPDVVALLDNNDHDNNNESDNQSDDHDHHVMLTVEDVRQLPAQEPGQALAQAEEWAGVVRQRVAAHAASLRQRASAEDDRGAGLAEQAAELRREAEGLRAGKLLPLPRPDWAGPGDDEIALGAALDWKPDVGDELLGPLEVALTASGLLGATLTEEGALTKAWSVSATGAAAPSNLTAVLVVDVDHPLADAARAVLERVTLVDTAADATDGALLIGRDGTFRAGVLSGAPGLIDASAVLGAGHVGGRQRRAAAFARAEHLEDEARRLDGDAQAAARAATDLRRSAADLLRRANRFPSRGPLRAAEALRAGKASEVVAQTTELGRLEDAAARLRGEHQQLLSDWQDRTAASGLPTDVEELAAIESTARAIAATVRRAATHLADVLAGRYGRLLDQLRDDGRGDLDSLFGQAEEAADQATRTRSQMDALREAAGADIDEVLENHRCTSEEHAKAKADVIPARTEQERLIALAAQLRESHKAAEDKVAEAEPYVELCESELNRFLDVDGVVDAVLDGRRPAADDVVDELATRLASVKTYAKKTLRDRYDEARARLAGSWALAMADPVADLDTFVFSYDDASLSPARAAGHARSLADSAELALATADEAALRDFVVGLLPSAIRSAWQRMRDWTDEVNRKMKSAAASSQLRVQVRVHLSGDLSEHSRLVHDLSCDTFDRTPEQNRALGMALQSLIEAADGETMKEKVAAAVNIRDWVDVMYEIHRPDGSKTNWTSKTGLSGGERRLVVLAPMLAAVAASFDRHGETSLRLAALDEVPAEVDERGREGLARYLAQLDLDLVCTSYLWDGAPGAWDGIDAWDLEAGPDTTVVAFPMLVRGLVPLPGDTIEVPAT